MALRAVSAVAAFEAVAALTLGSALETDSVHDTNEVAHQFLDASATCPTNLGHKCTLVEPGQRPQEIAPGPGKVMKDYLDGKTKVPPCEVATVDYINLTEAQFMQNYVYTGTPVKITNVPKVLKDGPNDWSRADFLRRFPNFRIAGNSPETRDGDEVASFADLNTTHPPRFFMQTDRALYGDLMRNIREDLTEEPKTFYHTVANGPIIAIGGKTTWNRIHQHAHAWQAQIHGNKLWWLTPPHFGGGYFPEANMKDPFRHWGGDNCDFMEKRPLPSSKYCLSTPGSVIYVPEMHWHGTCNMDEWTMGYGMEGPIATMHKAILFEDIPGYEAAKKECTKKGHHGNKRGRHHRRQRMSVDETGMPEWMHTYGAEGDDGNTMNYLERLDRESCRTGMTRRLDGDMSRPLPTAASHGHVKMVQHFLKEAKESRHPVNRDELSEVLAQAFQTGQKHVVEFLLREDNELSPKMRGQVRKMMREPCMVNTAAMGGTDAVPLMQFLIEQGASVSKFCNQEGIKRSTLSAATTAFDGGNAMVRFLEKNGADGKDVILLYEAAKSGHYKITEHFMKHQLDEATGAPLRKPDMDEALRWAAASGRGGIVDMLLQHNASALSRDRYGRSAIDRAVPTGELTVVRRFVPTETTDPAVQKAAGAAVKVALQELHKNFHSEEPDHQGQVLLMYVRDHLKKVASRAGK